MVEQEHEAFNCETCPLAAQLDALDGPNTEAWWLYKSCCNRFLVDAQAVPMALERLTAEQDAEQFAETLDRLRIIHDVMAPRKQT
jgi:hypothetical protein